MPLCYSTPLNKYGQLGIWKIQESSPQLEKMWTKIHPTCTEIPRHPQRKQEFLASRLLLSELAKEITPAPIRLQKTTQGSPYLVGSRYSCSLSHAWPYAAACLQLDHPVGIDIAALNTQALRISPKFLSKNEQAKCLDKKYATLYWAAKEATYKYTGGHVKHFKSMHLETPSALQDRGRLQISLPKTPPYTLSLGYFFLETHVLVYVPLAKDTRPLPAPHAAI